MALVSAGVRLRGRFSDCNTVLCIYTHWHKMKLGGGIIVLTHLLPHVQSSAVVSDYIRYLCWHRLLILDPLGRHYNIQLLHHIEGVYVLYILYGEGL